MHASSGYKLAMAHQPKPAVAINIVVPIIMLVFAILFVAVAGTSLARDAGAPIAFKLFFFAAPTLMAIAAIVMIAKGMRYAKQPIEKDVLVVVGEREEVSSGVEDRMATTRYYATLQDRNGGRVEYETEGSLAGRSPPRTSGWRSSRECGSSTSCESNRTRDDC